MRRASAQLRATLITLFLSRFTLSDEERNALTSREVIVGPAVFSALDRVEAIRQDSQALLSGDEERTQAGYAPLCTLLSELTPVSTSWL
jgi:hypothetical protein